MDAKTAKKALDDLQYDPRKGTRGHPNRTAIKAALNALGTAYKPPTPTPNIKPAKKAGGDK